MLKEHVAVGSFFYLVAVTVFMVIMSFFGFQIL